VLVLHLLFRPFLLSLPRFAQKEGEEEERRAEEQMKKQRQKQKKEKKEDAEHPFAWGSASSVHGLCIASA
jgi:hypothetical protein